MRLRQFIAAMMVLLSLTTQARAALACAMTPNTDHPAQHCCPGTGTHDHSAATHAKAICCALMAPGVAPLAYAVAPEYGKHRAPSGPLDFPVQLAPPSHFLLATVDPGGRHSVATEIETGHCRIRPLYLQTARLRL